MHPLYHQARRLVGRPIYVHHVSGQLYAGTLHSVTNHGIYVMPHAQGRSLGMVVSQVPRPALEYTDGATPNETTLVYSPGWYFGWGALAGLSAAAIAAPFLW